MVEPGEASLAVTATGLRHDDRSGGRRALGGRVARAIVHDDDLSDEVTRQRGDDRGDGRFLVERGNDGDHGEGHGARP